MSTMQLHIHRHVEADGTVWHESCPQDYILCASDPDQPDAAAEWAEMLANPTEYLMHFEDPTRSTRQSAYFLCEHGEDRDIHGSGVTRDREVFSEWAAVGLACPGCREWLHA